MIFTVLSLLSLRTQHLQRRVPVPSAGRGSLSAHRLSDPEGTGGPPPGVQAHHAPGAAAAPRQVGRGRVEGGATLPLPPGVPPGRRGLHLRPTRRPKPRLKSSRDRTGSWVRLARAEACVWKTSSAKKQKSLDLERKLHVVTRRFYDEKHFVFTCLMFLKFHLVSKDQIKQIKFLNIF